MILTEKNSGFTLIELVVVISLISIMLFFSLPRFKSSVITDNEKEVSRWIMTKVRVLKTAAVVNQKLYVLIANIDKNKFWVVDESIPQEEFLDSEYSGYELPAGLRIVDIEYPMKGKITMGSTQIHFYKNNYSDKVLIHMEDGNFRQFSLLIEPFLPNVKYYENHIGFEN
jgi:prepilin-type N-terminal cleavage/methylation domain-containing protein